MQLGRTLSLVLLSATLSASVARRANENPLGQVLKLLDGLAAKVTKEGEQEEKTYKAFIEWCDDAAANKGFEIKTATAKKEKLEAAITKSTSDEEAAEAKIELKRSCRADCVPFGLGSARHVRRPRRDHLRSRAGHVHDLRGGAHRPLGGRRARGEHDDGRAPAAVRHGRGLLGRAHLRRLRDRAPDLPAAGGRGAHAHGDLPATAAPDAGAAEDDFPHGRSQRQHLPAVLAAPVPVQLRRVSQRLRAGGPRDDGERGDASNLGGGADAGRRGGDCKHGDPSDDLCGHPSHRNRVVLEEEQEGQQQEVQQEALLQEEVEGLLLRGSSTSAQERAEGAGRES